jgi:hypothetical protein
MKKSGIVGFEFVGATEAVVNELERHVFPDVVDAVVKPVFLGRI